MKRFGLLLLRALLGIPLFVAYVPVYIGVLFTEVAAWLERMRARLQRQARRA